MRQDCSWIEGIVLVTWVAGKLYKNGYEAMCAINDQEDDVVTMYASKSNWNQRVN